ncbi:hypothetical protein [Rhizohabitans arisaemae]|uniref:hypothetical protein n=1 Tax=Rhizohabitans arisaemae TaxID=2720610 RepID=UPI003D1606BD
MTNAIETPLLQGTTKASYYWDDGSGINGDTGMPASGKPMQKGLFASPSWPLGTEGYVLYEGKKEKFFIGDRGPGIPSNKGVMLDMDGKTFAALTGGSWNQSTLTVEGHGLGHIHVTYHVTKWGPGIGKKGQPQAFSTGAWKVKEPDPTVKPVNGVNTVSVPLKPFTPAPAATAADTGAAIAPLLVGLLVTLTLLATLVVTYLRMRQDGHHANRA